MKKLEIGSGNRPLEGFDHLDINPDCPHLEYVAPMEKLPVDDNTYDVIKAIHVIEHQPWRNTLDVLKEWVRVLKPGGQLEIATPNLKWIADTYLKALSGEPEDLMKDVRIMNEQEVAHLSVNGQVDYTLWANFKIMSSGGTWDQHFASYDFSLLSSLLMEAGCSQVESIHDGDSLVVLGVK